MRVEIAAAQRKITTRGLYLKDGGGVRALTASDLDKYDVILGIVSKLNGEKTILIMRSARGGGGGGVRAGATIGWLFWPIESFLSRALI